MTHAGYILTGWIVTFGSLGLYAAFVISRGRAITAEVAEDRRRWMTTADATTPDTATPTISAEGTNS